MDRVGLYEEFRLIERCESEINGAWKGAHLLLFFLAFVFGTFCTFCFHMLMYLFDEKCVLFPKILSVTAMRNRVYNFLKETEVSVSTPVDFVSTQWVEESACYLPTYVPLVSGLFGLVWTTMFLMCSTGSRTLSGLQRPWRILPPVFIFSVAMGSLCIYTSTVTHAGLQDLCHKLSEITGKPSCTFTINVVTLAYERRIRGVYQATRLTIISAWLHTSCWLLAAGLALMRIALIVDFRLVRIRAELQGNIEKMLEHHEKHIRTVSPDFGNKDKYTCTGMNIRPKLSSKDISADVDTVHYISQSSPPGSVLSLVPEERDRLVRLSVYRNMPKDKRFIVKMLYDMLDNISIPEEGSDTSILSSILSSPSLEKERSANPLMRQYGRSHIDFTSSQLGEFKIIKKKRSSKTTKTEVKQKPIMKKTTFKHTFSQTNSHKKALQIAETMEKPVTFASLETLKPPADEQAESSQIRSLQEIPAQDYLSLDTLKEDLQPGNEQAKDLQPNIEQIRDWQPKDEQELQREYEQGKDFQSNNEQTKDWLPKDEQTKELQPEAEQAKDLQPNSEQTKDRLPKDEQAEALQPNNVQAEDLQAKDKQAKELQPEDEQTKELQPEINQAENLQQPEVELAPRDSTEDLQPENEVTSRGSAETMQKPKKRKTGLKLVLLYILGSECNIFANALLI